MIENSIIQQSPESPVELLEKDRDGHELTAAERHELAKPLNITEQELLAKIIDAPSKQDLEHQFDLFNINQSKKNALRIIKLNGLLSKVEDQAIERMEKRPDMISNKELLEYMNTVSGQIDRAQSQVGTLSVTPAIQVANQDNSVNISMGNDLDRDSKDRVINAISQLLHQVKQNTDEKVAEVQNSTAISLSEDAIIDKTSVSESSLDNIVIDNTFLNIEN